MQLYPGSTERYETFLSDTIIDGFRNELPPVYTPIVDGYRRADAAMRNLIQLEGPVGIAARRLLYAVILEVECPGTGLNPDCFLEALQEFEPL